MVDHLKGEDIAEQIQQQLFGDEGTPQWFKDRVRETMKKDAPKLKTLPKKLYHGTALSNLTSIEAEGLRPNELYGNLYFCESMEDVRLFIQPPCVIFEVDKKKLLPKRFRLSLDHNKKVYPCEAYSYFGDVPAEAIIQSHIIK